MAVSKRSMLHPSNDSSLYNVVLVSAEQIARVDLLLNIVQATIVTVGNDSLTTLLELLKVVHDLAAKESRTILQSRFVNDDRCAFGFDALHDTLNRGLCAP